MFGITALGTDHVHVLRADFFENKTAPPCDNSKDNTGLDLSPRNIHCQLDGRLQNIARFDSTRTSRSRKRRLLIVLSSRYARHQSLPVFSASSLLIRSKIAYIRRRVNARSVVHSGGDTSFATRSCKCSRERITVPELIAAILPETVVRPYRISIVGIP